MRPDKCVIFICTGENYLHFLNDSILGVRQYLKADILLLSDRFMRLVDWHITIPHLPWPLPTLLRYHHILKGAEILRKYQHLLYLDLDMKILAPLDDFFSDGLTVVLHGDGKCPPGTPELNPKSTAYFPECQQYVMGAAVGGTTEAFLEMAETIKRNVNADLQKRIIAKWWDEAHLNRYIGNHPPAKILPNTMFELLGKNNEICHESR